jgi:predicted PurR-regulated permease PerM
MSEKDKTTHISISTGSIIRVFLVALGFFLVWYLRDLVMIVFTSIVLASFVESTVPFFKKIRFGRVFGIVTLYVVVLSILAGLFYLFAPLLITEVYNFSGFLAEYIPNSSLINYFQNDAFSGAKDIINNLSHSLSLTTLLDTSKAFITNLSGGFFQTLSAAFGNIFNVVLIIIISFYLSIQEKGIENFLRIILPIKYEEYAVDLWERSRKKIALWVRGQMLISLLVAILIYLILSLIGIQYALLLALVAGIMQLVPYGVLIAVIPAIAFAYMSNGVSTALAVALAYLIVHQFETFLFTPLIIKRVVGLTPLIVILSVLIGFELGGFWGMVLSIPAAVFIMELSNDIEKRKISTRINNE